MKALDASAAAAPNYRLGVRESECALVRQEFGEICFVHRIDGFIN
jgi:hypothetical protein